MRSLMSILLILHILTLAVINKETEPAIDIIMIFVKSHDVVAVFDELKIGEFFLVDTEDLFLVLLFFLLF